MDSEQGVKNIRIHHLAWRYEQRGNVLRRYHLARFNDQREIFYQYVIYHGVTNTEERFTSTSLTMV